MVVEALVVVAGEEAFEEAEAEGGVLAVGERALFGGEEIAADDAGVSEGVLVIREHGVGNDGDGVLAKEILGDFVAEGDEAHVAAGVEDIDGVAGGFVPAGEEHVVLDELLGVVGAETVGDGDEDVAPAGEPAADAAEEGGVFGGGGADAGLGAGFGVVDVAGAEGDEGEAAAKSDDEAPDGDEDDGDGGDFDEGGEGLDGFWVFDDDFREHGVFDVVFEVGFAFLELELGEDAAPGFFEGFPVAATDVGAEKGEGAEENRENTENNKCCYADHAIPRYI